MKVAANHREQEFKPVVLTITLESQDELDRMWAVMNHLLPDIAAFIGDEHDAIRNRLYDCGATRARFDDFRVEMKKATL